MSDGIYQLSNEDFGRLTERLRAWMPYVDRGTSWTTSRQADLRALLDSHERMRLALEGVWKIEERVGHWHPNGGPEPPDGDHAEICAIVREGLGAYWGPNEEGNND